MDINIYSTKNYMFVVFMQFIISNDNSTLYPHPIHLYLKEQKTMS